jgi:hypothetical protein
VIAFAAALLASFLPRRHWSRFPSLPVATAAPVAALVVFVAAAVLGIGGFMSYADGVMSNTARLQVAIAERQIKGELPETAVVSTGPMAVALLSPLAFVFLTPTGQVCTYFGFSSLLRSFVWVADGPMGDPALSILDALFTRTRARLRGAHERRSRERREGAAVADRLYEGQWASLEGVDFVVVASRRKEEWLPGATIVTATEWFTLGVPFDLTTADGLRTVYPLTKHRVTEVLRRGVPYELPPLRRSKRGVSTS